MVSLLDERMEQLMGVMSLLGFRVYQPSKLHVGLSEGVSMEFPFSKTCLDLTMDIKRRVTIRSISIPDMYTYTIYQYDVYIH